MGGRVGSFGPGSGVPRGARPRPRAAPRYGRACTGHLRQCDALGQLWGECTGTSQGLGRFASVSLFQFDGYGSFTANETFNSDQQAGSRSISGTYSVNADCTFTLSY